jgi:hypothetical protein
MDQMEVLLNTINFLLLDLKEHRVSMVLVVAAVSVVAAEEANRVSFVMMAQVMVLEAAEAALKVEKLEPLDSVVELRSVYMHLAMAPTEFLKIAI